MTLYGEKDTSNQIKGVQLSKQSLGKAYTISESNNFIFFVLLTFVIKSSRIKIVFAKNIPKN